MELYNSIDLKEANSELTSDTELSNLFHKNGVEFAGGLLNRRASDGFTPTNYWKQLVKEIRELLCNPSSENYSEVRTQAEAAKKAGKQLGLPAICSAIAVKIGLDVALITPFVALLLSSITKIGINAWCKNENISKS